MCSSLEVSKSGYYLSENRKDSKRRIYNLQLIELMKVIHKDSLGAYGAERIQIELVNRGFECGIRLVSRLMKVAKISSKIKGIFKPTTTDSNHNNKVSENILNREFEAKNPNEKWVSDITYIKIGNTWAYLCVIIDLFNREVIAWNIADNMEANLVVRTYRNAIRLRKPKRRLIFHTDRGVQYSSKEFRNILSENVIQSMSRKGNCWDNAVAESFFKTLKVEYIYHRKYSSIEEARSDLFFYIEVFYNKKRLHSTLNFTSPSDFTKQYLKNRA